MRGMVKRVRLPRFAVDFPTKSAGLPWRMSRIQSSKEKQSFFRESSDRESWNAAVERLGGSVLQSWEWGEFRRRHKWEPLRLLAPDGQSAAQVLLRKLPALGYLAYAPHGPLAEDPADLAVVTEAVGDCAARRGACLLDVEPRIEKTGNLEERGFVKMKNSVQPRCTFVLDVLDDPEQQLAALPKDARYGVRRARREGVEIEISNVPSSGLEEFLELLGETAKRQHFALRPGRYYREFMQDLPAHLILARRGERGELLAGALILTFGEEAYYLYGASAAESENLYASYLIQYEALTVARREGASRYDMWGPCEPREGDPMWGVYKFKKKFGGEEKRYAGLHEKNLRPTWGRVARTSIQGYYAIQKLRGKSSGPQIG